MGLQQRLRYLMRLILNSGQKKECPYCHSTDLSELDRKYYFSILLKCNRCGLNHRHPKDNDKFLREFYQKEYSIETHLMTKFPSNKEIEDLKQNNFPLLRSYDKYLNTLFNEPINMIDYGCSWGYNVFKLINSGYNAVGYELSIPRAEFGKNKLGVTIFTDTQDLPKENDIILSSHVIEHLSDIEGFVSLSKKHLKPKGIFMAFCPNGSKEFREREPEIWHVNWGEVHPNYLDVEFAKTMFKNNPYLILTGDWDFNPEDISNWDGVSQIVGSNLNGKELLIISKPNITIN